METTDPKLDDLFQSIISQSPSDRAYAASIYDANRRALAGEILVALIRSSTIQALDAFAAEALRVAAVIYPPAPIDDEIEALAALFKAAGDDLHESFDRIFTEGLAGEPVPPPAAAQEGIEAVFDAKLARDHRAMEGMRQADPMSLRAQRKDHR